MFLPSSVHNPPAPAWLISCRWNSINWSFFYVWIRAIIKLNTKLNAHFHNPKFHVVYSITHNPCYNRWYITYTILIKINYFIFYLHTYLFHKPCIARYLLLMLVMVLLLLQTNTNHYHHNTRRSSFGFNKSPHIPWSNRLIRPTLVP